jgi:hypothetical protein
MPGRITLELSSCAWSSAAVTAAKFVPSLASPAEELHVDQFPQTKEKNPDRKTKQQTNKKPTS